MQIVPLVEKWRDADFAVEFGRIAPRNVMVLVRTAAEAGVDRDDLKLLVLNQDLRIRNKVATIRNGISFQILSWLARAVFFFNFTYMALYASGLQAPLHITIALVVIVSSIYGFLWRGFSLFTTRPLAAAHRIGSELVRISHLHRDAEIRYIHSNFPVAR